MVEIVCLRFLYNGLKEKLRLQNPQIVKKMPFYRKKNYEIIKEMRSLCFEIKIFVLKNATVVTLISYLQNYPKLDTYFPYKAG